MQMRVTGAFSPEGVQAELIARCIKATGDELQAPACRVRGALN
jgi:hypothetical protein